MIIRLTDALRKKLKVGALETAPMHENPLADWTARLFYVDRVQYVLVCNTPTFYAVVLPERGLAADGDLIVRSMMAVMATMHHEGYGHVYDQHIAPETGQVRFCKTLNRTVTGTMTIMIESAIDFILRGDDLFEVGEQLHSHLTGTLSSGPRHYGRPCDALGRLLRERGIAPRSSQPQRWVGRTRFAERLSDDEGAGR